MGASIVWGHSSFDGNGFRLGLQNLLKENGTGATMVGTQWSGEMVENHHEAYEGVKISELNNLTYHSGGYDMNPNVILVHVGTNDCWWVSKENGTGAAERMGYLLDSIHARAPDALVLQSTLIRSTADGQDICLRGLNAALPPIVEAAQAKGQTVTLVDMYDVVPADQMSGDSTHPTDVGYQLMAKQWYDALVNATDDLCTPEKAGERAQAAASSSSVSLASAASVSSSSAASLSSAEASSSSAYAEAHPTSASATSTAARTATVGGSEQTPSPTTAASAASDMAANSSLWWVGVGMACIFAGSW